MSDVIFTQNVQYSGNREHLWSMMQDLTHSTGRDRSPEKKIFTRILTTVRRNEQDIRPQRIYDTSLPPCTAGGRWFLWARWKSGVTHQWEGGTSVRGWQVRKGVISSDGEWQAGQVTDQRSCEVWTTKSELQHYLTSFNRSEVKKAPRTQKPHVPARETISNLRGFLSHHLLKTVLKSLS